jgi:myo-inositol-1(or 4)-monophosphatase
MMKELKEIAHAMEEVAREAGNFIRREAVGFDINDKEIKGFNNFVSYVDKSSEKIIVEKLGNLLPEASFMTEEGTVRQEQKKYCWVIDPLDGTTNFLHGLPPYAVSIGLMEENEVIAGVIYEITGNEMFTAWRDGGSWLNGKPIHVSDAAKLSDSLIATGFPYTDFSRIDQYMECFTWFCRHSHGVRRLGSAATDIAYIACGRFEVFYEYSLHPWDIAAGIIILREAGGSITDFSGNGMMLDGKEIVAAGNPVFPEALEIIGNFMKPRP